MRRALLLVSLTGWTACTGCGSTAPAKTSGSSAFQTVLEAKLTASAETARGAPDASGTARITLSSKTLKACWTFSVKGLVDPLSAHIHKGPPGEDGPVVVPLGARYGTKGCVIVPLRTLKAVGRNPGQYYVNIHTKRRLNGAIRGQLTASS